MRNLLALSLAAMSAGVMVVPTAFASERLAIVSQRLAPALDIQPTHDVQPTPYVQIDLTHRGLISQFGPGTPATLTIALPEGERTMTLELQSFDVFSADARIVVDGFNGERDMPRPDVLLLTGQVAGVPGSHAFLGSSDTGIHGYVEADGRTWIISTGPHEPGVNAPVLVAPMEGTMAEAIAAAGFECTVLIPPVEARPAPASAGTTDFTCRLAQVAIETDYEFTGNLFGGSVVASGNYAAILTAAVSEVYRRDLNLGLQISYLRLWDDPSDPWTGGDTGAQLNQFRAYWQANMGAVQRDAAHMFSGRGLGGGVAWLNAVCGSFAYAVSANLGGSFPYPIQNNNGANWDLMVVAHEWGHNFGAQHTHDLVPPPDLCGQSNCAGANMGTIMSYCHLCSGGMSNMRMEFHPQSQAQMDAILGGAGSCVAAPAGTVAAGELAVTIASVPLDLDVLSNDAPLNCEGVVIESYPAVTPLGGSVQRLVGAGPGGRDMLRYTPPPVGGAAQDSVVYTVRSGVRPTANATASISIEALREPDPATRPLPGLDVAFYSLPATATLPNFGSLTPSSTLVVSTINYPSTGGVFGNSGLADFVGAVYAGFINVPTDGYWTLYVESDDGSRVLIGDTVVVSNDGLHGMVERSGQIALKAGRHAMTVEFFENEGGAGLILRASGPGMGKQVVPASMLTRLNPCPADLTTGATAGQPGYGTPNGVLNNDDFFYFLAQFASGTLSVADLTTTALPGSAGYGVPNGLINNDDFFYYLVLFSQGC